MGSNDEPPGRAIDLVCPPAANAGCVTLAHGAGGLLSRRLIRDVFEKALGSPELRTDVDAATFDTNAGALALTTDAFVVRPPFFPGGDIGSLAVFGTANDLAMAGARPLALSAAFVIEEGVALSTLERVAGSMRNACERVGARIVTGDTKVVERARGDEIFVTTSGVGMRMTDRPLVPERIEPGDAVLLSSDIGRHGLAVMLARGALDCDAAIESDSGPLISAVERLIASGVEIKCLRDATRGGLAASLVELAEASKTSIDIDEATISITRSVRSVCRLYGFDPLTIANEGCFVAIVAGDDAERALAALAKVAPKASVIGHVRATSRRGDVTMRTELGGARAIDLPRGELLPRIC